MIATTLSGFIDHSASYSVENYVFPSLAPNGAYRGALFTMDTSKVVPFFSGPGGPSSMTPVGTYTSIPSQYIFSYNVLTNAQQFTLHVTAAPVPEGSTTVSLGLLLALGMGGLVVAGKRRKAGAEA